MTSIVWLASSFMGQLSTWKENRTLEWLGICSGGITLLRLFAISTLRGTTCLSLRWWPRIGPRWLGPSFCTFWGPIYSLMVGRLYLWGGWLPSLILGLLGRITEGRYVLPIYTLPWIHLAEGPHTSLLVLGSSSRFVSLPFLLYSSCIAIMSIHMSFRPKLYIMLLWTVFVLASCKLYHVILQIVPCHLPNCASFSFQS